MWCAVVVSAGRTGSMREPGTAMLGYADVFEYP